MIVRVPPAQLRCTLFRDSPATKTISQRVTSLNEANGHSTMLFLITTAES